VLIGQHILSVKLIWIPFVNSRVSTLEVHFHQSHKSLLSLVHWFWIWISLWWIVLPLCYHQNNCTRLAPLHNLTSRRCTTP